MSSRVGAQKRLLAGRGIAWAWAAVVALLLLYTMTRSSTVPGALVASQIVFLVPVFGAALLTLEAFRVAPRGDERRVWGLLSLGAWLLAASESYYSWYQISVNPAGPVSPSANDWFNLAAALGFLGVVLVASGLPRYGILARMRLYADALAVMALSLMVLFRFWSGDFMGSADWFEAVRWATYTFFGVALLGSVLWLGFGLRGSVLNRTRNLLIGVSVGIFAAGIIAAPFVQQQSSGSPGGVDPGVLATNVLVMAGYSLMAVAATMRVRDRRAPWQSVMSRPPGPESDLPTSIMSVSVLLAIMLAGVWAYGAATTEESSVYFVLGVAATFSMVARTAVLTFETGTLREHARRDPLTGIENQNALEEELETRVRVTRRSQEPFVLAILNLDDFTRVNEVLGRAVGDRALIRVGEVLQRVISRRSEVFRLAGDQFAVIVLGYGLHDRMPIGSDLLAAVSEIELGHGLRLSASIGVVSCDDGLCAADTMLAEADAAQVWAKYHGKGRVVVHDERIVRALGTEERLRLNDARMHFDVARALAASADARDPRSFYHSRNVSALAVLLGEAVELDEESLRVLEIAAMLHDVGQIVLPDELVVGPFTHASRLKAREHASLGAQLVESVGAEGLSEAVRSHHERWDGGGYPDGLSGEQISIEARIIALADAYDGMTSGRRSGTVMSRAAALQEIDHALGTRFDPQLAEQFIRLVGTTSSLGWSNEWAVK